ncbi:MAG: hypothetical protein ACYDBT_09870 [Desulfobulbaceae bacterium]
MKNNCKSKLLKFFAALYVFIFFTYGCSVKIAPQYSGEQFKPETNILYSSRLNIFINVNNVGFSTSGTGKFKTSMEEYLKNYMPNWNIYFSSYLAENVSNDFRQLHIFINLGRKRGMSNLSDALSRVVITNKDKDIHNEFEVSMESQSAGMGFFDSYRVREGHNFAILVGKQLVDTIGNDKKLVEFITSSSD